MFIHEKLHTMKKCWQNWYGHDDGHVKPKCGREAGNDRLLIQHYQHGLN
jgi:hypothetical protein